MPQITKLCLHIFCYAEKTVVVLFFSGHGVEYRSLYRTLDALCILIFDMHLAYAYHHKR